MSDPGCNGKCCATTSIAGTTECGRGELDANGFWEFPCDKCTARVANSWAMKCEEEITALKKELANATAECARYHGMFDGTAHLLMAARQEREKLLSELALVRQERDDALSRL